MGSVCSFVRLVGQQGFCTRKLYGRMSKSNANRYLLGPLTALDVGIEVQKQEKFASNGSKGFEAVAASSAKEYPTRVEGWTGIHEVFPYHDSVQDWMMDADGSGIDLELGHAAIGRACFNRIRAAATAFEAAQASSGHLDADFDLHDRFLLYALRYALTHLLSAGLSAQADSLLLDFNFFWPAVYTSGFGSDIVRDLAQTPLNLHSDVSQDSLRWLRFYGPCLTVHPRAALQLACDAPTQSIISRHANQLPQKPHAKLQRPKPDHWPPLLSTLKGHGKPVMSVAVCGNTIVCGSRDGMIRILDLESGDFRSLLEGHGSAVEAVALSQEGTCVSGSLDKTVRVWDLQTSECRSVLEGHSSPVSSVALCDGRVCVSGSWDKTVRIWDLPTGESKVCRGHDHFIWATASDGTTCVSGALDKTVRVWDLQDGQCRHVLEGHTGAVRSVALDGLTCVSASDDKTVRVWNLQTGECRHVLQGHSDNVLAVSLAGGTCVSGSRDSTVRVWDVNSGECKRVLDGHQSNVTSVSSSADGRVCVSGSEDETVRVWDLQSDLESKECGKMQRGHRDNVLAVALSPDGRTCVSGSRDNTVRIWDTQSGECRSVLTGHSNWVYALAFCPDGDTFLSGSFDSTIRLWDLSGKCKGVLEGHFGEITGIAVSPDGSTCVSEGDGTVRTWDLVAMKQISCFDEDTAEGDQQLATLAHWKRALPSPKVTGRAWLSEDKSAIFWDVGDGSVEPIAIYLPPSVEPLTLRDDVTLLPSLPTRTISFFGKGDNALYSYKVLA